MAKERNLGELELLLDLVESRYPETKGVRGIVEDNFELNNPKRFQETQKRIIEHYGGWLNSINLCKGNFYELYEDSIQMAIFVAKEKIYHEEQIGKLGLNTVHDMIAKIYTLAGTDNQNQVFDRLMNGICDDEGLPNTGAVMRGVRSAMTTNTLLEGSLLINSLTEDNLRHPETIQPLVS
ncbi:MAG: hypothetical protein ABIJ43_05920 [Candidatus Beckwithbacteria bacterium]|nr:hypothetical protein [Patescibacteria group bacterium]